ncbi:hypothetical protein H0H93_003498 [Arthromyces matolae]|nr:hypothetical protein H0H93_003498 [Arthromyces matolae]
MGLLAFFSSVDDLNNRFSPRFSLPFSRNTHDHNKPALSTVQEQSKKSNVSAALLKRAHLPSSQTRAKRSALLLRQLIVGPSGTSSNSKPAPPQITSAYARPQLNKLKTELMEPKSANKVIAQLRALPVPAGHQPTPSSPSSSTPTPSSASPQPLPILMTSVVEASESKASVTFAAEVAPASLSNPAAKAGSVKA